MIVRKAISENEGIYFITLTCSRWMKLFEMVNGYDIVYNWFDHLKSKGRYISGYVIKPNHLHAVIAFQNTGKSINSVVGNGKRLWLIKL